MSHGNQNSLGLKNLNDLLLLAVSLGHDCDLDERDILTVSKRVKREGLPFLTVELPRLAKALCAGVSTGKFVIPSGYKTRGPRTALPAFLNGLFSQVFDVDGFYLNNENDGRAFKHIYQFCSFFYKMVMPYDEDQISAFADGFIRTDAGLSTSIVDDSPLIHLATSVFTEVLGSFDPEQIICKDGPGAIANGTKLSKGTKTLDNLPITRPEYLSHFFLNGTAMLEELNRLPDGDENPAVCRVIFVPKDSRGPRVISAEPRENQFVQQGIRSFMYDAIEHHPLTRGQVNFSDQGFNKAMAQISSSYRSHATIDLKEASDRVSSQLVWRLMAGVPLLRQYTFDSRSTIAQLPDGRTQELNKFAPMGSALCFPVMALTIFSLIYAAMQLRDDSLDHILGVSADRKILVYGDDIIVHKDFSYLAMDVLEEHGLLVNAAKSYVGSHFAESCGMDAYRGIEITPVRLRVSLDSLVGPRIFPNQKKRFRDLTEDGLSLVETINLLSLRGYNHAAKFLMSKVEGTFGHLPFGNPFSGSPNIQKGTELEEIFSKQVRKPRYWRIQPVKEVNQDETGWTHLMRTIHTLGRNAELPGFGEYELPRRYVIVPTTKPRWFDAEYPASTWLPT